MIVAAIVMPVTLAFTALAVEGGLWYADHHQLRTMADTAALAAGWARFEGLDEQNAALNAAPDVGFKAATDDIDVVSPPTSGAFVGDAHAIEVTTRRTRPLLMAQLFLASGAPIDIRARAVVEMGSRSGVCVLALDPSASGALTAQGNADINFNGCGVNVNSNSSSALDVGGAALLNVDWAEVTGAIATQGGGTLESAQTPKTGMPPRPNPYADLSFPGSGACGYTNLRVSNTSTLTPGRYCGGISFTSHAVATLSPGTYIMDGGSFGVAGGASVTGNGVTIVLTGSGSNYATVTINGGATVNITAPSSGIYTGIAFMQSPNAPSGTTDKFNGGSTMDVDGVIYFPKQALQFNGGNTTGNRCTRMVADTITFTGNAVLGNNCSGLGLSDTTEDDPRLVE